MIFLESFLCCIGKGLLPSDSAARQPDFSLLVNKQTVVLCTGSWGAGRYSYALITSVRLVST